MATRLSNTKYDLSAPPGIGLPKPVHVIGSGKRAIFSIHDLCIWLGYNNPVEGARHWVYHLHRKNEKLTYVNDVDGPRTRGRPRKNCRYYCSLPQALYIIRKGRSKHQKLCLAWLAGQYKVSTDTCLVTEKPLLEQGELFAPPSLGPAQITEVIDQPDTLPLPTQPMPAPPLRRAAVAHDLPRHLDGLTRRIETIPRPGASPPAAASSDPVTGVNSPLYSLFKLLLEEIRNGQERTRQQINQLDDRVGGVQLEIDVIYDVLSERDPRRAAERCAPVNRVVHAMATEHGYQHKHLWNSLYDQLGEMAGMDWHALAEASKRSTLREVHHRGWLEELETLALSLQRHLAEVSANGNTVEAVAPPKTTET